MTPLAECRQIVQLRWQRSTAVGAEAEKLDELYASFNYPDSAADPIQIVRRFTRADDREVVGFCAAALAFGRVASVLQSIERAAGDHGTAAGGVRPADSIRGATAPAFDGIRPSLDARGRISSRCSGCCARCSTAPDRWKGSFSRATNRRADDIGRRSTAFRGARWRSISGGATAASRSVPASATSFRGRRPAAACKRLNLFLRWMVRRDALDLGVWTRVSPAKLVVPLDTHVIRVGRCLRLTRYTSPGWRMARDITASLRAPRCRSIR